MDIRMDGKRVLVTGGSSGIGEAMVLAFADAGADVAINYRTNQRSADALVARIREKGGRAVAIGADVSQKDDVQRLFAEVDSAFGGLDVLLDNAGIDGERMLTWDPAEPDFERVVAVDLLGAFFCAREALKRMVAQESGVIVFTTSVHQVIAWSGHAAYTAAKAGVAMMMQTMAQEAGPHGVRALAIAPGAIETPINAAVTADEAWRADLLSKVSIQRIGQPEEIAALALFLASDRAGYITGTTIYIDGGMTNYPAFVTGG